MGFSRTRSLGAPPLPNIVIPANPTKGARAGIALQQRSGPSLQPFATATAIPASAGMTSKKTSPHRHSGEPHKRGKGRRSFSTAKLVIALQQRSRPSLRPFATAIAIPASAGMTSKKTSPYRHSGEGRNRSSTTKPSILLALRNSNCDPGLRRDDGQGAMHATPLRQRMGLPLG